MSAQRVYFIEGDGIGPEITAAMRTVLDRAVEKAYAGSRVLEWEEVLAGEKAYQHKGAYLPQETLDTLRNSAEVAIKGPLTTPVGAGYRSLNVALRQIFDLYACIRPVRYFTGLQTPVKRPDLVDMVVFRENTEDVYAGIEWPASSREAERIIAYLRSEFEADIEEGSSLGIKPITERCSKRLVRRAIRYALEKGCPSVTLVHKGNIMKFTEGAFRTWGYEVGQEDEFRDRVVTEEEHLEGRKGEVVLKDRIADNMFQQILTRPDEYSVLATMNLNGDYLSDALSAQVGGLGIAPGANVGDDLAIFEATHGTVPKRAGTDTANPCSLILSGALMLEHLGWTQAAERVTRGIESAIAGKRVTGDLARQMEGATRVGCKELGALIANAV
jgi:isocitrate dehydrogenase